MQHGQRTPNNNKNNPSLAMPVSWTIKGKIAEEVERDRVRKYAPCFLGNTNLPIPDLAAVEPKTLFLIVTDLRTRPVGLKKEFFRKLLRTAGIPCRYFCRRIYATLDVLQPSEDIASKPTGNNITTKNFWLQHNYRGKQMIRM